jgi:glycosyltransferase involved in cell wall biosynthesis
MHQRRELLVDWQPYPVSVPIIIHTFHGHVFHSYFGAFKTNIFKAIERFLASRSTKIVAISKKQKEELSLVHRICKPEKIEVIPLGFDLNRFQENIPQKRATFRSKYGIQEHEIAVGIIGRLVPVKNHKLFIDAAKSILASTDKTVKFVVIGDGELREELLNYCNQRGVKCKLLS